MIWISFNGGKWHEGLEAADLIICSCPHKPKLAVNIPVQIRKTKPKNNICKICGKG